MAQTSSEVETDRSHTYLFWSSGVEPSRGWDDWIETFNREMSGKHKANLQTQTEIAQGSTTTDFDLILKAELFFALGREGQKKLLNSRPELEYNNISYKQLKNEAQKIFQFYQKITKQRIALFSRTQEEDETLEMFLEHLNSLASSCDLGNLQQSIVRDVLIANMSDKQLKEELCKVTLSPDNFVRTVIKKEPLTQQQVEIRKETFNFKTEVEPTRCFVAGYCNQGHSESCRGENESELFDGLIEKVQKDLTAEYEKTLITLPRLPDCIGEKYPSLLKTTMSDRHIYDYLIKHELKGVLLRDVSRLINTGVANRNSGVLFLNFEESFNKFILLKRIPISKSDSVEDTFDLLVPVIQSLDVLVDTFLQGRQIQCCHPFTLAIALVVPRLYGHVIDTKNAFPRTCHEIVCKFSQLQSSFFRISVMCFGETKTDFLDVDNDSMTLGSWIKNLQKSTSGFIPSLLLDNILTKKNDVVKIKLSERLYHSSGGQDLNLTSQQSVLNKFDEIFPHFKSRLEIVPDLNKIEDNIMYNTEAEEGRLPKQLNEISGYVGETQLFPLTFIKQLESPCGIFVKDWTSKKFELLLSGSEALNIPFQIDWLYCGFNCVAMFEVGLVSGEHASTIVRNKLKQVLDCHVQKMLLISFPIMQSLEMEEQSMLRFFSDHFIFFIYLPNVSTDVLKRTIKEINYNKKKGENKELFARLQNCSSLSNHVKFLVHTVTTSYENLPNCYAITLDEKKELFLSEERLRIGDIFKPSIADADSNALRYVEALLAFGFLAKDDCIDPPDHKAANIETKYQRNQQNWTQKHKKRSFFNIILSPQQYSILERNHSHVCLVGEPGTGKTSLLLAKAIRESENPEVDHTFFVVPATKLALFDAVNKHLNEIKSSVVLIRAASYKHLLKQLKEKWMSDDPSLFYKSAMVVDEAYFYDMENSSGMFETEIFSENVRLLIYLKMRTCWLAHVVLGRATSESVLSSYKETFTIEPLNIVFRNSHHISLLTHSYIHKQKKVDESTSMVQGCFTSSQTNIQTDTFSNYNDPKLTGENFLLPQLVEDRILIIFTIPNSELENSKLVQNYIKKVQKPLFAVYKTAKGLISGFNFAGIEAKSVLIIIDKDFDFVFANIFHAGTVDAFETNEAPWVDLLVLAINRAQYEVGVLIHDETKFSRHELDNFFRLNSKRHIVLEYLDIMNARNKSSSIPDLTEDDASELVSVLLFYSKSNFEDWLQLLKKVSIDSKAHLLHQMAKIYENSGSRKEDAGKFIAEAFRMHKDVVPEFFFCVWRSRIGDCGYLVDVLDRLLRQFPSETPVANLDCLSALCQRGSHEEIESALSDLESLHLRDCQLNKIYDSGHTNLTLLCHRLSRVDDSSKQNLDDVQAMANFMPLDWVVDDSVMLRKVNNMNVFELAFHLNVFPMIFLLINIPTWRRFFLNRPNDNWKTENGLCEVAKCLTTGIKDGTLGSANPENKIVDFVDWFLESMGDNARGILLEKLNLVGLFLELGRRDLHRAIEITEKFKFSQRQIELMTDAGKISIHDLVMNIYANTAYSYKNWPPFVHSFVKQVLNSDERLNQFQMDFTAEHTDRNIQALREGLLEFFEEQIRSGELEFLVRFTDAANEFHEGGATSLINRRLKCSTSTLFHACFNSTPTIVGWAVKLLQKHGLLEGEMNHIYKRYGNMHYTNRPDARDLWECEVCRRETNHTVLKLLCTMETAPVESVEILLENIFPSILLNHKTCAFCSKTACELAENRGKPEIAEAIRKYKKEQDELEQQQMLQQGSEA